MNKITIYVKNGLDQDVTIQVMANKDKSTSGAVPVGSSFTVAAGDEESRTLTPDTSGWLPYVYVTAACATAPSSGRLDVYRIREVNDVAKLVNSIAIRDTSTHTPGTDPEYFYIKEW